MRFRFSENMYGTYETQGEPRRSGPFDFSCTAEADLREFLRTKTTRITGVVRMEGTVREAKLDGTLFIDPLFSKRLVYDFTFRDGSDLYRFLGQKNVSFLSPVSTMTTLFGTLEKGGLPFAKVESHFRLRELPSFLLSYRLLLR